MQNQQTPQPQDENLNPQQVDEQLDKGIKTSYGLMLFRYRYIQCNI